MTLEGPMFIISVLALLFSIRDLISEKDWEASNWAFGLAKLVHKGKEGPSLALFS